jgi:amino acid permease
VEYIPLEPGAFVGVNTSQSTSLGAFLGQIFNWGIAIAVVLTIVMIIMGGIQYMTTDSFTGKESGREKINDALIGLGIALISWLLLYTINPNLVNFSQNEITNTQNSQQR